MLALPFEYFDIQCLPNQQILFQDVWDWETDYFIGVVWDMFLNSGSDCDYYALWVKEASLEKLLFALSLGDLHCIWLHSDKNVNILSCGDANIRMKCKCV